MYISILLLTWSLGASVAFAQVDEFRTFKHYAIFQNDYRIDTAKADQIFARFNNTNFFKNNEFKNPYVIGRTLIGLYMEPSIDYYPGNKTKISVGIHLLKYHGTETFDRQLPLITIQHHANEHLDLVFGSIYGTANHGLIEPMMSFEKYLIDRYENGFQFLFAYPNIKADLWLNWEQFIKTGDPFQEHITGGGNVYFNVTRTDHFHIGIPVQAIVRHKGGQIDSSPLPAGTQSNFSQGIVTEWIPSSRFLKSLSFEQQWVGFYEINPGNHIEITKGLATYSIVDMVTRMGSFQVGYWQGHNYFSPHGEPLFLSSSLIDPTFYAPERKMLTIKYQIHKELTDFLDIAFRFEPYYHFDTGRLDHSWGIYLMLDKDFFVAKPGKNFKKEEE